MENADSKIIDIITEEFKIKRWQAENTIELIDDGNTIPFIARYRKEATDSMDDQLLRQLDTLSDTVRLATDIKSSTCVHANRISFGSLNPAA